MVQPSGVADGARRCGPGHRSQCSGSQVLQGQRQGEQGECERLNEGGALQARLEEQKKEIIQQKVIESIQRIEKGAGPSSSPPQAASLSLKQVVAGAHKSFADAMSTENRRRASATKSRQQPRGSVSKGPQHALLKKKIEQKQTLQQQKAALEKNKPKPTVRSTFLTSFRRKRRPRRKMRRAKVTWNRYRRRLNRSRQPMEQPATRRTRMQ